MHYRIIKHSASFTTASISAYKVPITPERWDRWNKMFINYHLLWHITPSGCRRKHCDGQRPKTDGTLSHLHYLYDFTGSHTHQHKHIPNWPISTLPWDYSSFFQQAEFNLCEGLFNHRHWHSVLPMSIWSQDQYTKTSSLTCKSHVLVFN